MNKLGSLRFQPQPLHTTISTMSYTYGDYMYFKLFSTLCLSLNRAQNLFLETETILTHSKPSLSNKKNFDNWVAIDNHSHKTMHCIFMMNFWFCFAIMQ